MFLLFPTIVIDWASFLDPTLALLLLRSFVAHFYFIVLGSFPNLASESEKFFHSYYTVISFFSNVFKPFYRPMVHGTGIFMKSTCL